MDTADLARLLENLLRIGTIAEVRHSTPPAVRVQTGGITTTWRPWAERRAGTTRTWNPPTVGEQVLLFCPSGDLSNAVILCGIPTAANDVPSADPNRTVTLYPDGALTSYDHATGLLTVQGVKTVFLEAAANVLVKAPNTIFDGDVTVKGRFAYENGITGHGGENGNKITGSLTHEGGQLSSNGVVVDDHDHGGVHRGGDWSEGTR
ncbi:phage baseplate assembly protein V [Ralstonia solanacearum]|uniref:phage baseplate assembly protein V n=1 Tax=Ralstonia solanacearum TaxID=305 RepID=UPI00078B5156|nr:phage baseplate assembly protein V [Ralstonia solanacearum]AMP37449.1 baseplate assembly protein [Ralstonia solanacearum]AXV86274.1 phage baseplate assembly protein V [Ralstonia solanacearum]AXW05780.1 phage baseplate assembly protein V [Ralstonia solanacearum]AXW23521.1 phage baseplate assembly protein V [Ralstonia solanacearum]AXW80453.1 phage baseplate assembly protein V [Ralstonia solanacearum]